ncbi:hypothetical protein Calhy_1043 [Caldicellulosiruptor hydrothermalis 108]|uniref:Uncharacterized protein n=1 Tax=Caldicellulosiruptor hydrothermalis (strain DSM 18901 / VKM B-2411 / 108) TaxID=632292 RepID=E4Q854_CALH1|nr:hypothetical protein Calhy_1043 [Caldicellulosiruptor hydrothermalis 108]
MDYNELWRNKENFDEKLRKMKLKSKNKLLPSKIAENKD